MSSRVSEHTFDYQPVLAQPRQDAEQVTELWPGEPFTVEERRDGWARIRTTYDYPGWIRESALGDPIAHARTFLGTPYRWGGMSKEGVDCSGLVHMSFRAAGRLVPRDADQQEAAGEPVTEEELRPGDLISYGDAEAADHIAFWLGDGRILHSTRREGVDGVVEEQEPDHLRARRRRVFRF
ncbi:MAG TPA: C40 family peptidase [Gaiellaceae bacterium]|nr:C40 family peptidase [Gaiellaceae bacterium]